MRARSGEFFEPVRERAVCFAVEWIERGVEGGVAEKLLLMLRMELRRGEWGTWSSGLFRSVVERYLCLSYEEVDRWRSDPQSVCFAPHEEPFESELREVAEECVLVMLERWSSLAVEELLGSVVEGERACRERPSMGEEIRLDGWYYALGLAVDRELVECPEVEEEWSSPILRRRMLWLAEKSNRVEKIPRALERVVRALSSDPDVVNRLSAARALQRIVDGFRFDFEQSGICRLLELALSSLCELPFALRDQGPIETALQSLSHLLLASSGRVGRRAEGPLRLALSMWAESSLEPIRGSVLELLSRVVSCLETESNSVHEAIAPIIACSVSPDNPLLEEGLGLWVSAVRSAPSASEQLVSLLESLSPVLLSASCHCSPELLDLSVQLVESHVLMGFPEFVGKLWELFCRVLDEVNPSISKLVSKALYVILLTQPSSEVARLQPVFSRLASSVSSDPVHCPVFHLELLNLLLLFHPPCLASLMSPLELLSASLRRFHAMEDWYHRKAFLMAACSQLWTEQLSSRSPVLSECISLCLSSDADLDHFEECEEAPNLDPELVAVPKLHPNSLQAQQLRQLRLCDPVRQVELRQWASQALRAASALDGASLDAVLSSLPEAVKSEFR
ncbi:importin-11-like [Schistocerca gregaria]|uniref:importin-11-like n=1 Tax=Schistocerca gregaria TaxID=7010 RepID=UPI00211DF282|nr:importin-11-like [Schistocerca gregaria]